MIGLSLLERRERIGSGDGWQRAKRTDRQKQSVALNSIQGP